MAFFFSGPALRLHYCAAGNTETGTGEGKTKGERLYLWE